MNVLGYQRTQINYDQLDSLYLRTAQPFILEVDWKGVKYEFLIKLRDYSTNLLVFGSGAMMKSVALPYFQRHSWMHEFEDSMIYYNDPTLYLGNLQLGWGQGTWDRFYLQDIATILNKLIEKTGIKRKNVFFYGSSAGGFMSLMLAGFIRETTAIVNSPQTCLSKWLEVPVQNVFNLSYPGLTINEVLMLYPERINVMKFYNRIKYVPKVYYLQNAFCEYDITGHLIPFISVLQFMDQDVEVNKVTVDLYYDRQQKPDALPALGGHGATTKLETIHYINRVKQLNV